MNELIINIIGGAALSAFIVLCGIIIGVSLMGWL